MKPKIVVVAALAILLIVVAAIAYSGYFDKNTEYIMQIVDVEIKSPKPSLLNAKAVTINRGESITIDVTVQNQGEEIIYRNSHCTGIELVYPEGGTKYWQIPAERLITIDLGPKGKASTTFTAYNRKEHPFSGYFKFRTYIRSINSSEKLARSDNVTVEIKQPNAHVNAK